MNGYTSPGVPAGDSPFTKIDFCLYVAEFLLLRPLMELRCAGGDATRRLNYSTRKWNYKPARIGGQGPFDVRLPATDFSGIVAGNT